jgi:hypothetical protein
VGYLVLNLFEFVFGEGRNGILFFIALGMLQGSLVNSQGLIGHPGDGEPLAGDDGVLPQLAP